MIEVEKKFILNVGDKERLLGGAQFVGKTINRDVYYDTPDFFLAQKDWWLRKRNGCFELKIPLKLARGGQREKMTTQYTELNIKEKIEKALGVPLATYQPVMDFVTTRGKYTKEGFSIDLDSTDFEFEVGEIELMVERESQAQEANDKITAFAKKHGLSLEPVYGKVMEYLKRFKPKEFEAIIAAWNTREK